MVFTSGFIWFYNSLTRIYTVKAVIALQCLIRILKSEASAAASDFFDLKYNCGEV